MSVGTIKWFNARVGQGMIAPEDGSTEVWLELPVEDAGLFAPGQRVRYHVLTPDWGRPTAVNLAPVEDAPVSAVA